MRVIQIVCRACVMCLVVCPVVYRQHVIRAAEVGITSIGRLPGYATSMASYVTPDGQYVIGGSGGTNWWDASRAVLWSRAGGLVNLGVLPGDDRSYVNGISNDGTVITGISGSGAGASYRGYRWTLASGMVALQNSIPSNVFTQTGISGITGDGTTIVGTFYAEQDWAVQSVNGGPLSKLQEQWGFVSAQGISNDGSVVIGMYKLDPDQTEIGVRWTQAGGYVPIPGLLPGNTSYPNAISADGSVIAGWSNTEPGFRAIRWSAETGTVDLGLPNGASLSQALGMNLDGSVIVGTATVSLVGEKGFIWTQTGGMQYLSDYLAGQGVDLTGWTDLRPVRGVSADGRTLVGYGYYNGVQEGFVVTVPEPSSSHMLGAAGCVGVAWALARRPSRHRWC